MNNAELYAFINGSWDKTEIITSGNTQTIYQGKCANSEGSESAPIWCIKKTVITTNNASEPQTQVIVQQFANGNMQFNNVWNDRASLTYKYL